MEVAQLDQQQASAELPAAKVTPEAELSQSTLIADALALWPHLQQLFEQLQQPLFVLLPLYWRVHELR